MRIEVTVVVRPDKNTSAEDIDELKALFEKTCVQSGLESELAIHVCLLGD